MDFIWSISIKLNVCFNSRSISLHSTATLSLPNSQLPDMFNSESLSMQNSISIKPLQTAQMTFEYLHPFQDQKGQQGDREARSSSSY